MTGWLPRLLLPALLVALCAGLAHAQSGKDKTKLYRWVDKDGQVHYGDSVPPEYAEQDRDILNRQGVPGWALGAQACWACVLCLSGRYGDLLDYVILATLIFYVLTIAGLFRLRHARPDIERPYRALGYPWLPALYIAFASAIGASLLIWKPAYTWPGLVIVLLGVPVFYALRGKQP